MTDDELLEAYRNSTDKEESRKLLEEIQKRIKKKNSKPHDKDCICVSCTHEEEN